MASLNKLLFICYIVWSANFIKSHCAPSLKAHLEQVEIEDNPNIRIIDGEPASRDEFPFLVSVRALASNVIDHVCVGTLTGDMSTVVTAAHCVNAYRRTELSVAAGAYFLSEAKLGIQQSRQISRITYYPNYTPNDHDIAILQLDTPFTENISIKRLPMANSNQITSGRCTIAGWGLTEGSSDFSNVLMKGFMTVNDKRVCASNYPQFNSTYQLCVGHMNGERVSPCWGDTGGPLVCNGTDGEQYFAGIASWGRGCGVQGWPTVFMEVAKYRDWINLSIIQNQNRTDTKGLTKPSNQTNKYYKESKISKRHNFRRLTNNRKRGQQTSQFNHL